MGIVSAIRHYIARSRMQGRQVCHCRLVGGPRGQRRNRGKKAPRIDHRVDLGAQSAMKTTGGVNRRPFRRRLLVGTREHAVGGPFGEGLEDWHPDHGLGPSVEPVEYRGRRAIAFRRVAQGRAGPQHQPVMHPAPPRAAWSARAAGSTHSKAETLKRAMTTGCGRGLQHENNGNPVDEFRT